VTYAWPNIGFRGHSVKLVIINYFLNLDSASTTTIGFEISHCITNTMEGNTSKKAKKAVKAMENVKDFGEAKNKTSGSIKDLERNEEMKNTTKTIQTNKKESPKKNGLVRLMNKSDSCAVTCGIAAFIILGQISVAIVLGIYLIRGEDMAASTPAPAPIPETTTLSNGKFGISFAA
jgi:hypothetical protein